MGCIDCARSDRALAVEHLTQALVTNAHHLAARTLLGYLTGGIGQLVADYFMIQNLNKTALVYNSRAY